MTATNGLTIRKKPVKCDSDLLEEIIEVLERWNYSKIGDKKAIELIFEITEQR